MIFQTFQNLCVMMSPNEIEYLYIKSHKSYWIFSKLRERNKRAQLVIPWTNISQVQNVELVFKYLIVFLHTIKMLSKHESVAFLVTRQGYKYREVFTSDIFIHKFPHATYIEELICWSFLSWLLKNPRKQGELIEMSSSGMHKYI